MSLHPRLQPGYAPLPDGSVRFTLRWADARSAAVAGTFSDWAPIPMAPTGDGWWEAVVPQPGAGVHFYKFILDGRWLRDPTHPMGEPDGFGGTNSAFGTGQNGNLPPGGFRVVSLNLHTYQEADPLLKLEQVAHGMAALGANVGLLQEVGEHVSDRYRPNAGGFLRATLERLTGRPWYHEWREAHPGFQVYREGVSVLADSPPRGVREYRLSGGRYARNALAATVNAGAADVRVCSVHLSWPSGGGDAEAAELLRRLEADDSIGVAGTLVGGDFNADPTDEAVRRVIAAGYHDAAAGSGDEGLTVMLQRWQGAAVVPDAGGELFARIDYQFWKGGDGIRTCRRVFNRNVMGGVYLPRVSDHVGLIGVYDPTG